MSGLIDSTTTEPKHPDTHFDKYYLNHILRRDVTASDPLTSVPTAAGGSLPVVLGSEHASVETDIFEAARQAAGEHERPLNSEFVDSARLGSLLPAGWRTCPECDRTLDVVQVAQTTRRDLVAELQCRGSDQHAGDYRWIGQIFSGTDWYFDGAFDDTETGD